jgi:solute carrier family 25 (mitochondrial phosphate transporter), member 23/24/25/41
MTHVAAMSGRQVYQNVLHAMYCIIYNESISRLYRILIPSYIKHMPITSISFTRYEAC